MTDTEERPEIIYEIDGHVAILRFNRPERMNTISGPMLASLSELLIQADRDKDVRCVIITGEGRAWCAGLDIKAQSEGTGLLSNSGMASPELDLRDAPPTVLHNMDTPVIAALNGGAAGYGMDLALGCDIRIAAATAKLAPAFTKRGIVPESGGTWLLPRIVGYAKAAEIAFTGRTLNADECLELGLVNHVVPAEELMSQGDADGRRNRRERAARRSRHEAHDADGGDRDVRTERAPRVPPTSSTVPHQGLRRGHGLLPRASPAELRRPLIRGRSSPTSVYLRVPPRNWPSGARTGSPIDLRRA